MQNKEMNLVSITNARTCRQKSKT